MTIDISGECKVLATMLQLASTAVGATVGGGTGAATALDGTKYNYLTHQQVDALNKAVADCRKSNDPSGCKASAIASEQQTSKQQNADMIAACTSDPSGEACLRAKDIAKVYGLGAYYGYENFDGSQLGGAGPLMADDVAASHVAYNQVILLTTPIRRDAPPAPDYLIVSKSGLGASGAAAINLHNGQVYGGVGGAVPVIPGANIAFGWLPESLGLPADQREANTDLLLAGGSVGATFCELLCAGFNHSLGGATSIEFGLGAGETIKTPAKGGGTGTGVMFPLFSLPWTTGAKIGAMDGKQID